MARSKKDQPPLTTAQQLGSLIKSARDIMRKDKGLSTDLDRLPMLTWIMFLKFLDDMEQIEEQRAQLGGADAAAAYRPAIDPPYRWRDWAAREDGITGPELLAFVSQEECTRPDGTRGLGLLPYLRSLQDGPRNRRSVIGAVFKDVSNRMLSGYLLRDVINKVNGIHFLAQEELFTLGHLYETMLREMRDAAGDNGEFYTPRPVVRFMVEVADPRLGETILDPACGTGGFLVEAYSHLEKQCQTVQDRQMLQECSIFGGEAKPLPYLLCQMNLLLHGLDAPLIDPGNSLRHKITELGDSDRVDVILTNPPFGGEEEVGIRGNFPRDMQTSETALLFLQLIMRKLRRGSGASCPGRAAAIVPNGTLSGDGVCARIKEQLLLEFDLHTIVRLPNGVFAPYTDIPTNLIFFERGGPTTEIWYYELPLPEGRKSYTKTKPLAFEEFADCIAWWPRFKREENEHAWRVPAADVLKYGEDGDGPVSVNLDIKNPNTAKTLEHLPPEQLIDDIAAKRREIASILEEIRLGLDDWYGRSRRPEVALGDVLTLTTQPERVDASAEYRLLGVRLEGAGPFLRETKLGAQLSASTLSQVRAGDFIYSRLFAWRGAFGVIPTELDGCSVSNEFPTFRPTDDRLDVGYLNLWFRLPHVLERVAADCTGSTPLTRNRYKEQFFLKLEMPLPPIDEQRRVVQRIEQLAALGRLSAALCDSHKALETSVLAKAFGIEAEGE